MRHDLCGADNPWDGVAKIYEEVRPGYPAQLMRDIVERTHLSAGDRLLEIGAGTGKATVMFAREGFRIHCIEPGPNLAGILTDKCSCYPNVTVDVGAFEEWAPPGESKFDLIYSAQAFDWLDPEIRFRKCHELLKEGGHLALFWYDHDDESWDRDIISSGLFCDPEVFSYHSEHTSDAETSVKAMESVSGFSVFDEDAKARMRDETRKKVEEQGGLVTVKLDYQMYLAKRL